MTVLRFCVLGDSHAGALRVGWKNVAAEHPEVTIDFFPCPAGTIASASMEGRGIVAEGRLAATWRLAAGANRIELDSYDGFVFAGFGTNAYRHLMVLRHHTVLGGRKANRILRWGRPLQVVSEQVLTATLTDRLLAFRAYGFARRIHALTRRPMFWIPTPRTSAAWLDVNGPRWFRKTVPANERSTLFACADKALADVVADLGCVLLPQPAHTLDGPHATRLEYLRDNGAEGRPGKSGIDNVHMSGAYGAIVWRTHIARILDVVRSAAVDRGNDQAVA